MTHNSVGAKLARPPRRCLESRKGGKQIGSSGHVLGVDHSLCLEKAAGDCPSSLSGIDVETLGGAVCRKEDFCCFFAPCDEIAVEPQI